MNKNLSLLILIAVLMISLQVACSFSDLLGTSEESFSDQASVTEATPAAPDLQQPAGQEDAGEQSASGDQPPCKVTFSGSSDVNPGQIFQPGDTIQVTWTLTNTSSCTWEGVYSLVNTGGDLQPTANEVPVSVPVAPGDSVDVDLALTVPGQEGTYISTWKLQIPQGKLLGQGTPPDTPLRINIKALASGSPNQNPTPAPTQAPTQPPQQSGAADETLLAGKCFDLNNGQEVACSDNKADIRYDFGFLGAKFYNQGNTSFGSNHDNQPDQSACEGESYTSMPHSLVEEKFFCFKIDPVATTIYGWIRIERFDEEGVSFDYFTFQPEAPEAVLNTNLFVESQEDQVTVLRDECFNLLDGTKNPSCSGSFSGFLFEEVTKKSLQVMQITPQDLTFAGAKSSEPNKSDCQNDTYNQASIWPISEKSYYCYQFDSGNSTYYGWLRPTSFNGQGVTFDYLTWKSTP